MTIWRVYHVSAIEAKTISEAADELMAANYSVPTQFFADEAAARSAYLKIVETLDKPRNMGRGVFRFDGVSIQSSTDCELDEDSTLEEAFYDGNLQDGDLEIGQ